MRMDGMTANKRRRGARQTGALRPVSMNPGASSFP